MELLFFVSGFMIGFGIANKQAADKRNKISDNPDINNCFICGSRPIIERKSWGSFYINCSQCNNQDFGPTSSIAIRDWNEQEYWANIIRPKVPPGRPKSDPPKGGSNVIKLHRNKKDD